MGLHRLFFSLIMHLAINKDALSACKMPKHCHPTWTHHKDGPCMCPTTLPNSSVQHFYFDDDHPKFPGHFKGMEIILCEHGLYPKTGLRAQCKGFKCVDSTANCCCRRVLFNQPDFTNQKSALEELIQQCGHICDFYPKYHCELNFIEQYWGAAKYHC